MDKSALDSEVCECCHAYMQNPCFGGVFQTRAPIYK